MDKNACEKIRTCEEIEDDAMRDIFIGASDLYKKACGTLTNIQEKDNIAIVEKLMDSLKPFYDGWVNATRTISRRAFK